MGSLAAATAAHAAPPLAAGAGYAVDAIDGDDANPGTAARPFRSLDRLSSVTLKAGEGIYLRCGSVWRDSLSLSARQLADGAVITAYGTDCDTQPPRITGADDVSGGWTRDGAVWSRRLPTGTPQVNRVFIDGLPLRAAQWPNAGAGPALSAAGAKGSVTPAPADASTLSGRDLAGASVLARTTSWDIETRTVAQADYATGRLLLESDFHYPPPTGHGYVLTGKRWMLDAPGEFFHDRATDTLHLVPPASGVPADLNAARVEASVRDTALKVGGKRRLRIAGLRLDRARAEGLVLHDAGQAVVEDLAVSMNGHTGIRIDAGPSTATGRIVVRRSDLDGNWVFGIDASRTPNVDIVGNRVTETGTQAYEGVTRAGILGGDGGLIEANDVRGAAYHGIRYSGTGGSRVLRNTIAQYCIRLTDCGAIYTWNGPQRDGQASVVEGNRIFGARANARGAVGGTGALVMGIYLDDYTEGAVVRGNTVHDVPWGIFLHNTSRTAVLDNRLWMTREAGIEARMDRTDADYMTGNVIRGNQLVPAQQASGTFPELPGIEPHYRMSHAIRFATSRGTAVASLGPGRNLFTENRIVDLHGASLPLASLRQGADQRDLTLLSGAGWRALNPGDAVQRAPVLLPLLTMSAAGDELLPQGQFSDRLAGWSASLGTGSTGSLAEAAGQPGCDGPCARYVAGSGADSLSSPTVRLKAGSLYLLRYRAGFAAAGALALPYIADSTPPWGALVGAADVVAASGLHGAAGEVLTFEAIFRPTRTATARLHLKVATAGVPVHIDGVSLRELRGYLPLRAAERAALAAAPADAGRALDCPALGWPAGCAAVDIDGAAVAWPAPAPAGAMRLLLRADPDPRR